MTQSKLSSRDVLLQTGDIEQAAAFYERCGFRAIVTNREHCSFLMATQGRDRELCCQAPISPYISLRQRT